MSPVLAETTITALERGILDRLGIKVPGLAVEAFPDKPEHYRLRHQVGALVVCYRGGEYSAPRDTHAVVQERTLSFDVHVLTRQLSGHQGAYVHIEAARLALTGHKVSGFRPLVPRREAFLGQGDGVWTFALTVSATTIAAELDEETAGALLERITLQGEYSTSEVTSEVTSE